MTLSGSANRIQTMHCFPSDLQKQCNANFPGKLKNRPMYLPAHGIISNFFFLNLKLLKAFVTVLPVFSRIHVLLKIPLK